MNLTIITPCSRPENLQKMEVFQWLNKDIQWIVCYDSEFTEGQLKLFPNVHELAIKGGVSGNLQRNMALNYIQYKNLNGFVYFLDDDTVLHTDFVPEIKRLTDENPEKKGFIFAQDLGTHIRTNTPDNIKVCHIDQAQYLLHTDLIVDKRFIQQYEADGIFIEEIYHENPETFLITDKVLCYYNYLRR